MGADQGNQGLGRGGEPRLGELGNREGRELGLGELRTTEGRGTIRLHGTSVIREESRAGRKCRN